ncbi:hypothetical protein FS837_011923 [Tulasnella sp. UAMH 9824]|nr:hypothetical protein FS837_011923 [Tulasnella sp. UAMH 9824]
MERFLATPELRCIVFTFLISRDLFNCAQVCRSWKGIALNVRWRCRDVGMRQLMGQLAPLEEEQEDDDDGDYVTYNRLQTSIEALDKAHWQSFLKLTSKIHVLSISSFFLHPDSIELLNELVTVYGGSLFPNLRRFEIWGDMQVPPMVPFGLVPSLTSVELDGTDSFSGEDGFEDIFPQVAEKCKRVRELDIVTECAQSGPMFDVFPDLRSLSYRYGAFSTESWRSLAKCPHLRELELSSVSLEDVGEDSLAGDLEFGSLTKLHVFDMKREAALVLLGGTGMPRLQRLRLERIDFMEEEKKDLSDRLKARCPDLRQIDFVSKT